MNPTELRTAIKEIEKNNGFIAITGYRSKSGQVANVTVQPLGPDGYHRLVRESVMQVRSGNVVKPDGIEQSVWEQAIESQLASWEKTLNGGHGRKDNYMKEDGKKEFYTHAKADQDVVYVRNVRIISKKVTTEGTYKKVNSRPLTIAKSKLVKQTPVSKYQATYKLHDENGKKFEAIAFKNQKF